MMFYLETTAGWPAVATRQDERVFASQRAATEGRLYGCYLADTAIGDASFSAN
jgi:hypothetical protein